jgi:hypothetical protein
MEPRNQNVWIALALILIVVCCCTVAAAAAVAAWPLSSRLSLPLNLDLGEISAEVEGERLEQGFKVGAAPVLTVDNFAGSVTVLGGGDGEIQVVAIKKGPGGDLDRIQIDMNERGDGLEIKTRKPSSVHNASVQLEITVPAGTHLETHTGAGSIEVRYINGDVKAHTGAGSVTLVDVTGELEIDTGAGSIQVRGATSPVRLETGAGSIDYQGTPRGTSSFETGTGSIELRLPPDLNVVVDLSTGTGSIDVDYAVDGRVTKQRVKGTIGSGSQGDINAHTGAGSIDLIRH